MLKGGNPNADLKIKEMLQEAVFKNHTGQTKSRLKMNSELHDYYKRIKPHIEQCTQSSFIEGAEHLGKCYTTHQVLIFELYRKLGEALGVNDEIKE